MTYKEAAKIVSSQLGLPEAFITKTYELYWKCIRDYIGSISLQEIQSFEEFSKLKTQVDVAGLGKFYIDWSIVKHIIDNKGHGKIIEDKADV